MGGIAVAFRSRTANNQGHEEQGTYYTDVLRAAHHYLLLLMFRILERKIHLRSVRHVEDRAYRIAVA